MENNVLISIKTYQEIDGQQQDDVIELQTYGKFGVGPGGKYYIMYDESEMTGFANTTTTIKVWPGNVCVTRKGKHSMKMEYEQGACNLCLYPTPYGDIGAAVNTFLVDYDFRTQDLCGTLRVDYTLDADNENFTKNSLNVKIKGIEKGNQRR